MNLETAIENYHKLDTKAQEIFKNIYWFLTQIHQVKREMHFYKITSLFVGFMAFFILTFRFSPNRLGAGDTTKGTILFWGTLLIISVLSYLIGCLIGLLRYQGGKSIRSLRYRLLRVFQHTEKDPLTYALQFIERNQPELINETDKEIRKKIKALISDPKSPKAAA